jgi:hypothetical protein
MPITRNPLPPKQTLLLILLPMLATFVCLRLYLHLHHLFLGVVIEIPAAFILAFGPRHRLAALGAPVALGIGSALILDEVTYLALTNATDADYISRVYLYGATAFISAAAILLLALYWSHHD